jgi:hypothetical protein
MCPCSWSKPPAAIATQASHGKGGNDPTVSGPGRAAAKAAAKALAGNMFLAGLARAGGDRQTKDDVFYNVRAVSDLTGGCLASEDTSLDRISNSPFRFLRQRCKETPAQGRASYILR